jgi:hypothetical protein
VLHWDASLSGARRGGQPPTLSRAITAGKCGAKPGNGIESEGVYKLIDFGIAAAERLRAHDSSPSAPEIIDDLLIVILRRDPEFLPPVSRGRTAPGVGPIVAALLCGPISRRIARS